MQTEWKEKEVRALYLLWGPSPRLQRHTRKEAESFLEPGRAGPVLTSLLSQSLSAPIPGRPPSPQRRARVTGRLPTVPQTQNPLPPLEGFKHCTGQQCSRVQAVGNSTGPSLPTAPPRLRPPTHPLVTPGREWTFSVAGYPGRPQEPELVAHLLPRSRELRRADWVPEWILGSLTPSLREGVQWP